MNRKQIIANLTALINRAVQSSDFQIASTMVSFADLPISDKVSLQKLIANVKVGSHV
jgi:hypothetical protein